MMNKSDWKRIEPNVYEVAADYREDMRVPARLYADGDLLQQAMGDRSIEQLLNTATLPGVVRHVIAMPDVHQGYGFPIGGVAATRVPEGLISPGGVGYDINCGVRLLASSVDAEALRPHVHDLLAAVEGRVGTGVGARGRLRLSKKEMCSVLERGAEWAVGRGYGIRHDVEHTEEGGCLSSAKAQAVSRRALERGQPQLGTLGAGNHFLEIDEITEVFDEDAAAAFGLVAGRACVWIHCGSRGLGHQVCTDAVRVMQTAVGKYHVVLPDRELAGAPFGSPEGQEYFAAMSCAANYAWANRQVITHLVREAFEDVLAGKISDTGLRMVYDVCHNVAKVEEHEVDGRRLEVCVHRKGATRAFGPGRPDVPADYCDIGQPVLIPGDMSTGSYVLVGTEKAMQETFGSTCHGAGRVMSRSRARRTVRIESLRSDLDAKGIALRGGSRASILEEAPEAYKSLAQVVQVVHSTGLARRVARTTPMGVIKG